MQHALSCKRKCRVRVMIDSCVGKFICMFVFFFKQKTAYEIGTGDWSSDVCSSDLVQACVDIELYVLYIVTVPVSFGHIVIPLSLISVLDRKSVV